MLKSTLLAGLTQLARDVDLINQLNVFPVPDGDTGVNMYHTLQRAWQEISELESSSVSEVAERFAYGALMGARGNSGTILSQLLRGLAEGLNGATDLTAPVLARGCRAAVTRAYAAVSQPVEGTILTVAREATASLAAGNLENETLEGALGILVEAAEHALEATPQQLPILEEAGVVDAGGMGLLSFLRGLQSKDEDAAPQIAAFNAPVTLDFDAVSFGYDVQFVMLGEGMDIRLIRKEMEARGESVIVAGDASAIKVHIHVDNPAIPIDYAVRAGAMLDDIIVENMQLQFQAFSAGREAADAAHGAARDPGVAVIAVAEGAGFQSLLRELNCKRVIPGGAGKNPATEDFLAAIGQTSAERVIILPNDRNVVLAAQQAADLIPEQHVTVLPTESVPQGINSMIAFGDAVDAGAGAAAITAAMRKAAKAGVSIALTRATRSAQLGRLTIRERDYIAIINGEIKAAGGAMDHVLITALRLVSGADKELATLYYGADVSSSEAICLIERLSNRIRELEFEVVYGGQPLYLFLISVQ